MKALILTDIQNDFLPGGALAVPEGDAIIPVANRLQSAFPLVVATQDWHPANHGSFAANHPGRKVFEQSELNGVPQTLWPVHCVQNTPGAAFAANLNRDRIARVFQKGTDPAIDSYSALFDNRHLKSTGLGEWLKEKGVTDVFVCGLATDYCVKFTALDAVQSGFRTSVIEDASRGVNLQPGDVDRALSEMKRAGVAIVQSRELSECDPSRPAGSSGENNAPVNVDAILQSILGRAGERFGMAAAVLQGERIIAHGAAGVRKRGSAERITFDDRFHLGSCTKAMTATLVAVFVEEGRLNWATTLGELFAGTVRPMHPAWEKVTLRQVLAHRAGLRLEADGLGVFNEMVRPPRARLGTLPQQRLNIARQALSRPPGIPPNTKYWYSNAGYVLAGAALEQLTGRAWEELMREHLFQPLGIKTGGFGPPGSADKTGQAWGHSPILGKPLDPGSPAAELPLFYGPAGLAHMTVADWAKFIALHSRGDPANPHCQAALLKPDTFAEMHAVAPATISRGWAMRGLNFLATGDAAAAVTYCAGWFVSTANWAKGARPADTGRRLWHAGSNGRWNCGVVIAPEIDFAVLVACNRGIAAWKSRQTVKALIRTFAPKRTS